MNRAFFALLLLALLFLAPAAQARHRHCWYNTEFTAPTLNMAFDKPVKAIADRQVDGTPRESYAVPTGTKLTVDNINTFIAHCVNGASTKVHAAVRLLQVNKDSTVVETSRNYISGGGTACGGGAILQGQGSKFGAYTFNATGIYTFQLEYAKSISSANPQWQKLKTFDVLVAPGRIEVIAFKKTIAGFMNNAYGQEDSVEREVVWMISNVGGIDVNIHAPGNTPGLRAVKCDGAISNCRFVNYRPEAGLLIPAEQSAYITERFTAKRQNTSPTKENLSIDVTFSDVYNFGFANLLTNEAPVEQKLDFMVAAQAIAPFLKKGSFAVEPNKKYYVQTCSDSLFSEFNRPLFGATIFDESQEAIANTNFHEVSDCSPDGTPEEIARERAELGHMNTGEERGSGLISFTTPAFEGTKTYTYELEGVVGAGDLYKSDFMHVGTGFDNTTQLLRGESIVYSDRLGRQELKELGRSANNSFTVNAFERTKPLGQIKPALAAADNAGPVSYLLTNVKINGKDASTGFVAEAETGGTTVAINTFDATATAITFVVGTATRSPPEMDVNLAWLDREKYMFEVKGLDVGVCRTLQGDTIGLAGRGALTGQSAKVRLKYEWKPGNIAENMCDPSNPEYVACDSTQFSTILLKKLRGVSEKNGKNELSCAQVKNGLEFFSYLIRDGLSTDFKADFAAYMKGGFFSTDYTAFTNDQLKDWSNYFSAQDRLVFEQEKISEPGVYKVTVKPEFTAQGCSFFDNAGNPNAKIKVKFEPTGVKLPRNVLYYIPIDATVGSGPNGLHRIGYGTGFSGSEVIVSQTANASETVKALQMSEGSDPITKVEAVAVDSFVTTSRDRPGQLLLIEKKGGEEGSYKMVFSPSAPVPVILNAERNPGLNSISIAYQLFTDDQPVVSSSRLARLTEIGFKKGTGVECRDTTISPALQLPSLAPNGSVDPLLRVPLITGWDKQLSAFASTGVCSLSPQATNTENTYFFAREGNADGNILLETVFYVPSKSKVDIKNACSSQGELFVPATNAQGYRQSRRGFEAEVLSDGVSNRFGSLREVLEAVQSGSTCIAVGTEQVGSTWVPATVGVWWNEEKIAGEFRAKLQQRVGADACYKPN